ncbi:hypothetical protein KJ980_00175 [Patescibacteria group bacterium]|nr:hypothetical protein [Patescibacteria group bacterium]MBU4016535.1 hypothetical protein [Patescibacteria group bacterium]MBU4098044.1 hypothetical protein [Patescibacteria group bacterium]
MKDIIIESTSKQFSISEDIIGFSGEFSKSRQNESDIGDVTRIKYKNSIIVLYHNPSYYKAHKPQDSLGIFIHENVIKFGIADGVSIVDGREKNDSGKLSLELIKTLPYLEINGWKNSIKTLLGDYLQSNFIGASTFTFGNINLERKVLEVLFVGSSEDIGINEIYQENEFRVVQNYSFGFLPKYFKESVTKNLLGNRFCLVFSSDGVSIERRDVVSLVESDYLLLPIKGLLNELGKRVTKTFDDQSMIIVQKIID